VANQALEHGYACIYSTECLFIRFNVPTIVWWMDWATEELKEPIPAWSCSRLQGRSLGYYWLPQKAETGDEGTWKQNQFCSVSTLQWSAFLVISEHQHAAACVFLELRSTRCIIPDLQSGFTVYSNWVSRWMNMIRGAVMLHDGAAGSWPGGMLQGPVVARTFSFKL